MSVLARKRSESPLRVYETASIIRRDVSLFMLQRFVGYAPLVIGFVFCY